MPNGKSARSACEEYTHILTTLNAQLALLDRAGAHKAAAHLDSAIQQLRRDQLALELATAARQPSSDHRAQTTISGLSIAPKPEAIPASHVVALKAKPANAR